MSTDDKFGIGTGLLALGLAAGVILLVQYLPPGVLTSATGTINETPPPTTMAATPAVKTGKVPPSGSLIWRAGAANNKPSKFTWDDTKFSFSPALDTAPRVGDVWLISALPQREKDWPEAVFDGIVCALGLPLGILFFVLGTLAGPKEDKSDE